MCTTLPWWARDVSLSPEHEPYTCILALHASFSQILMRWTDDELKSTYHRVRVPDEVGVRDGDALLLVSCGLVAAQIRLAVCSWTKCIDVVCMLDVCDCGGSEPLCSARINRFPVMQPERRTVAYFTMPRRSALVQGCVVIQAGSSGVRPIEATILMLVCARWMPSEETSAPPYMVIAHNTPKCVNDALGSAVEPLLTAVSMLRLRRSAATRDHAVLQTCQEVPSHHRGRDHRQGGQRL